MLILNWLPHFIFHSARPLRLTTFGYGYGYVVGFYNLQKLWVYIHLFLSPALLPLLLTIALTIPPSSLSSSVSTAFDFLHDISNHVNFFFSSFLHIFTTSRLFLPPDYRFISIVVSCIPFFIVLLYFFAIDNDNDIFLWLFFRILEM